MKDRLHKLLHLLHKGVGYHPTPRLESHKTNVTLYPRPLCWSATSYHAKLFAMLWKPCHYIYFIWFGVILIKLQFLINVYSISIISWVLLSISITISITKKGPYQCQYVINFSKSSLSISIPISILQIFLINISLSMHCATLVCLTANEYQFLVFWQRWQRWHKF